MTMRRDVKDFEKVNINCFMLGIHAQLLHRAAALRNETASAYMRRVLLDWAAADLGEAAPDLTEYAGDIIANAAKAAGLSTAEFTKRAAREAAARALGLGAAREVLSADTGVAQSLAATSAELGHAMGLPLVAPAAGASPVTIRPPRARISEPPKHGSGEHRLASGAGRRR